MLISDLEQLETLSRNDLVIGGLLLSLGPTGSIVLQSNEGNIVLKEELLNGKPFTSGFSSDGLMGSISAVRTESSNSNSQSVTLSGVSKNGGNFTFSSSTVVTS